MQRAFLLLHDWVSERRGRLRLQKKTKKFLSLSLPTFSLFTSTPKKEKKKRRKFFFFFFFFFRCAYITTSAKGRFFFFLCVDFCIEIYMICCKTVCAFYGFFPPTPVRHSLATPSNTFLAFFFSLFFFLFLLWLGSWLVGLLKTLQKSNWLKRHFLWGRPDQTGRSLFLFFILFFKYFLFVLVASKNISCYYYYYFYCTLFVHK